MRGAEQRPLREEPAEADRDQEKEGRGGHEQVAGTRRGWTCEIASTTAIGTAKYPGQSRSGRSRSAAWGGRQAPPSLRTREARRLQSPGELRGDVAKLVDPAPLPGDGGVDQVQRGQQPWVPIGHDEAEGRAEKPALVQVVQEGARGRLAFGLGLPDAQELPLPLGRDPVGAADQALAVRRGALHRERDPVQQEVAVAILQGPPVEAVDLGIEGLVSHETVLALTVSSSRRVISGPTCRLLTPLMNAVRRSWLTPGCRRS